MSGFKFPRLTLRGKRKRKEEKRALQEQMERDELPQDGHTQDEDDPGLANILETDMDANPESNPLLLAREDR